MDIKTFRLLDMDADDHLVLEALIRTIEFRDDYVGGGVNPDGDVHGPYFLDKLTPDAFTPARSSTLQETFRKWTNLCGSLPDRLRDTLLDQVINPIESATTRFQLRNLGEVAKNDYADIHNEFHEFVLINRVERRLILIVATDD
ncbi:hypothetical protein [Nocardia jiangxiensis]|uniref:hypothetical protein n=1 Tax=Nocardia jiangxiensis TaxID=282685 RepID=UPI00146A354B|nr:hypothetical protein [Nocardia jiangxiensis]